MPDNKIFWGKCSEFLRPSPTHTSLSRAVDIYDHEGLGFRGEKDDILLNHCLLLVRYYIYCCKLKDITASIREYVKQLKYNLEIERQVSIVTDKKEKFQQKWCQILHGL